MKKLITLVAAMAFYVCGSAQTIIKPFEIELKDSIFYQVSTAVFIIDKQDVEDYFKGLDTILPQRKFSKDVYRNIQFLHLNPEEVQRHYKMASKFWAANKNNPLSYNTDRISLFWNDTESILMPYLDEILPNLLEGGKIQVVDRSTNKRVVKYEMNYEEVGVKSFKIFKFIGKGRIMWRESEVFMEQMSTVNN